MKKVLELKKGLTTEVQVDGGCNFAELVFGLHFVEAGVRLDDVVQLEDDHVGPARSFCDLHEGSVVLADCGLASEPEDIWLRPSGQLALEDEAVAVILLHNNNNNSFIETLQASSEKDF